MDTQLLQKEFLVIARKWRPVTFDEVVGQEHVTTTLKNAIKAQRIAHAYLFTGTRGVGKTTTARLFARALNCETGPTVDPCAECQNCREIAQGNSLDVIEIDGASNRGIDDIRELRESIKLVPSHGKYKIYIIDEVHMLTPQAFNALLKTLEEPPAHAIFIFATTEPQKLLPTILSRCQQFDFHRITQTAIRNQLKKIIDAEGIIAESGVLDAIAQAGDGSMRDAQSMLDQVIAYCGNNISFEQLSQILGIYNKTIFYDLVTFAYEQRIADGLELLEKVISEGKNLTHFFEELLHHFRFLLFVKILKERTDVLDCSQEQIEKLRHQAQWYTSSELEFALELISEMGIKVRYALSKQVLLELLFLKLSRLKSIISIDQALHKLEEIQQRGITINSATAVEHKPPLQPQNPSTAQAKPPVAPSQHVNPIADKSNRAPDCPDCNEPQKNPTAVIDCSYIRSSWNQLCDNCTNPLLHNYLADKAEVLDFTDGILFLGVAEDFIFPLLKDKVSEIEQLLYEFYRTKITVKIKKHTGAPPNSPEKKSEEQPAQVKETKRENEILNDSKVQMMIDAFDAKVISVRRNK